MVWLQISQKDMQILIKYMCIYIYVCMNVYINTIYIPV